MGWLSPSKKIYFQKVFVKHWWLTFDLDWVKNGLVTVRRREIWSISLVPDCVTDSINFQSGLRQKWTGSQLIPSKVPCVLCPPKPAFSTHPQIISVVQTCEAQEPLIAPKRVSRKSIAVSGHTWLSFIKATALFFKHFRIGETPVLDISNLQELPGFSEEPVVI
jgi:hypothetical protein